VRAEASTYATLPGSLTMGHGIKVASRRPRWWGSKMSWPTTSPCPRLLTHQSDSHQLQEQTTTEYTPGNSLRTMYYQATRRYLPAPQNYKPQQRRFAHHSAVQLPHRLPSQRQQLSVARGVAGGQSGEQPDRTNHPAQNGHQCPLVSGVAHEYASVAGANGRQRYYLPKDTPSQHGLDGYEQSLQLLEPAGLLRGENSRAGRQ
jgi:hypothetical protein